MQLAVSIRTVLADRGWVHLPGSRGLPETRELIGGLGVLVGEEAIALRPGAHAYVAKPGPVPLHTDHPGVEIVCWFCEQQDEADGASLLLDTEPVIASLAKTIRERLRSVELACPPIQGGPPSLRHPVLWREGGRELVFCSPWLRCVSGESVHQESLDEFRSRISDAAKSALQDVRLHPGDLLLVDNRRMLHGRRAILENSRRRLHRFWVADGQSRFRSLPAAESAHWPAYVHRDPDVYPTPVADAETGAAR